MVRPQSEELNRSGTTPLDPDSIEGELEARRRFTDDDRTGGPVPPQNRPGHHPEVEQDRPDPDAFVARFSGDDGQRDDPADALRRVARTARRGATTAVRLVGDVAGATWRVGRATARAVREEIAGRPADDGSH